MAATMTKAHDPDVSTTAGGLQAGKLSAETVAYLRGECGISCSAQVDGSRRLLVENRGSERVRRGGDDAVSGVGDATIHLVQRVERE